jgi:uncharacterized protein with HEPN domain
MLEASEKAVNIAKGRIRSDLDRNEIFALAATRLLEILGEAANHVPDEIKEAHPEIPWREIIGVRNHLIHGYFDVDWDIIWQILSKDLPEVMPEIRKMVEGG